MDERGHGLTIGSRNCTKSVCTAMTKVGGKDALINGCPGVGFRMGYYGRYSDGILQGVSRLLMTILYDVSEVDDVRTAGN